MIFSSGDPPPDLVKYTSLPSFVVAVISHLLFVMVAVNFTATGRLNACMHSLYSSWCYIRLYNI